MIGSGVDASHKDFKNGQVLELSDPTDDTLPVLQKGTFSLPKDAKADDLIVWTHETEVASVIGGRLCGVTPGVKIVDVRVDLVRVERLAHCTSATITSNNASNRLKRSSKPIRILWL